jgi:cytoskeletal protein CcmA (bactofilin family)/type II secretory pathway pseudopilin PulG
MRKNPKKAITLIELIIVIAILSVAMGATSTFFISNYKNFNNVEDKADLQHSAQSVINEFSEVALNSNSYEEDSSTNNYIKYVFDDNTLEYDEDNNEFIEGTTVIASNITDIVVTEIGSGDGIEVEVTASSGDITETIETSLYFRNEFSYSVSNTSTTDETDTTDIVEESTSFPDDLVFYSEALKFQGNTFSAYGYSIVINGDLNGEDINGGSSIIATNIYIDGDVNMSTGGNVVGSESNPGNIYVTGNFELANGKTFYGDIYVNGTLKLYGGSTLDGNIYVDGDVEIYGGSKITGDLITDGNLDLDGGSTLEENVSVGGKSTINNGTIEGTFITGSDLYLKSAKTNGYGYVFGDVELDWTPTVKHTVEYEGSISYPNYFSKSIINKFDKINNISDVEIIDTSSFEVPEYTITLKSDDWYDQNGYIGKEDFSVNSFDSGTKILTDSSYTFSGWDMNKFTDESTFIVIVAKNGNITLDGNGYKDIRGVFIAPNGYVTYSGPSLEGIVIAKDYFNGKSGGSYVTLEDINNYFDSTDEIPVNISE